jgi:predicted MPP superfamily phosphohydrolase
VKRVLRRAAAVLVALATLLAVYGLAIEPRLIDERHYNAEIANLPPGWQGERMAVFSDLQVGMWWANTGTVRRVVERIVEARPAAALVVGDFLYGSSPDPPAQIETVLELLTPLVEAGVPIYAVFGNHDHATGAADELAVALEDHGITVLRNESVTLPPPGGTGTEPGVTGTDRDALHLVGIGPEVAGHARAAEALADVPEGAARIVLAHNPITFRDLPAGSAPLTVAGHTHCGQFALPFTPSWSWLAGRYEQPVVVDGWSPPDYGEPGNSLFVTCGIGMSTLPARVNAMPQLVFFELAAPRSDPSA